MGVASSNIKESYIHVKDTRLNRLKDIYPGRTFPDCIRYHALNVPSREAVVFVSSDGTRDAITFKELYEKSQSVARAFMRIGIKRREIIAINVKTCPEWLFLTFGSMFAGAVPISVTFSQPDGSDIINLMKTLKTCAMLIADRGSKQENWNIISSLIDNYSNDGHVHSSKLDYLRYLVCHTTPECTTDVLTLNSLLCNFPDDTFLPEVFPTDTAVIFQTSGSTGVPKCVAHSHSIVDYLNNSLFSYESYGPDDIYFCDRPFGWAGGFPFSIVVGQTRVTVSGFSPEPDDSALFAIDVIKRERCTVAQLLPPCLKNVLKHVNHIKDFRLKTIFTGGQTIEKELGEQTIKLCDHFLSVYGSTEMLVSNVFTVRRTKEFSNFACGIPLKGVEVKVVDEHDKIVPVQTRGDIYIRNRNIIWEYHNDSEKTASVLTDAGWFKTDDIGRMNENGVLYVEGRKTNIITSGGINIAPEIVETAIKTCPGVDNAVVVSVSDKSLHQVVCACVIIKSGSDLTENKIRDFCQMTQHDRPGLFTVLPKYYMLVEEFPETNTGKTSRKELTSMAEKRFAE